MSTSALAFLVALASSPVSASGPATALATSTSAASATEAGPTRVFIGTHVVEMRNVDVRSQSFYADFYLWLRFTSDEERAALIIDKLEPVNGKFESKDETERKVVDGQTYVCFRIT